MIVKAISQCIQSFTRVAGSRCRAGAATGKHGNRRGRPATQSGAALSESAFSFSRHPSCRIHRSFPSPPSGARLVSRRLHAGWVAAALLLCAGTSQALEYGPFCADRLRQGPMSRAPTTCARTASSSPPRTSSASGPTKSVPGATYGADTSVVTLCSPTWAPTSTSAAASSCTGCSASAGATGKEDIPGYLYEERRRQPRGLRPRAPSAP